jgi:hypothetical protein
VAVNHLFANPVTGIRELAEALGVSFEAARRLVGSLEEQRVLEEITRRRRNSVYVAPEEALTVLLCLIDDPDAHLNPRARCYETLKRPSDSEVIALFQQLEAYNANAPSCATLAKLGSSPTCFLGWWGSASFLVPSALEEAQALFGTPAERRLGSTDRSLSRHTGPADRWVKPLRGIARKHL